MAGRIDDSSYNSDEWMSGGYCRHERKMGTIGGGQHHNAAIPRAYLMQHIVDDDGTKLEFAEYPLVPLKQGGHG